MKCFAASKSTETSLHQAKIPLQSRGKVLYFQRQLQRNSASASAETPVLHAPGHVPGSGRITGPSLSAADSPTSWSFGPLPQLTEPGVYRGRGFARPQQREQVSLQKEKVVLSHGLLPLTALRWYPGSLTNPKNPTAHIQEEIPRLHLPSPLTPV